MGKKHDDELDFVLTSNDCDEEVSNSAIAPNIQVLSPKIQRFIHLYITGQYSLSKISQLIDVHPNTISGWLRRDDVTSVINELQETTHNIVQTQLKALTAKAVNRLNDLVDSPIDGVALQAVKDVLDRSGHKAKQEIKIDKTIRTFEEKLADIIDGTIVDEEVISISDE